MTKEKGELNNSCYEEKENKIVSDEHYTFELISKRQTKKPSVKNSTLGNYKHNKIESFNNTYFICSNLNMVNSLKETHDKKDISTFDKMLSKHGRTEFSPTYIHKNSKRKYDQEKRTYSFFQKHRSSYKERNNSKNFNNVEEDNMNRDYNEDDHIVKKNEERDVIYDTMNNNSDINNGYNNDNNNKNNININNNNNNNSNNDIIEPFRRNELNKNAYNNNNKNYIMNTYNNMETKQHIMFKSKSFNRNIPYEKKEGIKIFRSSTNQDILENDYGNSFLKTGSNYPSKLREKGMDINHYNTIRESNYDFKSALNVQFCKTKMCPYMNTKEKCKRFSNNMCPYAHDKSELKPIPNLYKTAMCRNFIKNMCFKSKKECNFAHHVEELRSTDEFYKTTLCKFFLNGYCKADKNCRHAHGYKELKRRPTNNMNMTFICGSKMNHNDMDTKKDIIDKEIMNNSHSSESVSLNENRGENLPTGDENELIVELKVSGEDENHLDVNKEDDMLNMRNTSKNNNKRDDYYNNSCKFMSISTKDTCCFISKNDGESSGDEERYRSKSECSNDLKEEDEEKAEKKNLLKLKEEGHNDDIKCIYYINDDALVKNEIELRGEDGKYANKNYQANISEEKEKIERFMEEEKDTHINMEYRCDSIADDESDENMQSEKFIRNTCLSLDGVELDDEKNENNENNDYNVCENNNKMRENVLCNNNSNEDIMNLQEEKFDVVSGNGDVKSYITYNHKMNHITKYHRNVDYDRKYFNNEGLYKGSFYYIKLNENSRNNYNNPDTNHDDNEYDNNFRGKDNNHLYNNQKKKNYNNEYNKNVYKNRKVFNIKIDNIRQKDEEKCMINDNDFNNKNGNFFDINKGMSKGSMLCCPIKYHNNNNNNNNNNSNDNNNNNNSDKVKRYLSNNEYISNINDNNNSKHIVNLNNYNNIGMNHHIYNNINEMNNYNYYTNYHCYNNINDSTNRYMNNNNSNNNNNNINYNNNYYCYYKNMKHGSNYEGTISTATTINNNHYNNNYIYEHSLSDISNIMVIPYRNYQRDKKDFSEHSTFFGKRNNSHMTFNNDIKDMEDDNMVNDISINRKAHNINVQKWIHGIHSNNKFNDTHNNNNNNNNNYNYNGNSKNNAFNKHGEIDYDHNSDDDCNCYEENNYLYDNIHNNIKSGNTLSENLNLRKTCSYDGEFFNDNFSHRTCSYERNNKDSDDIEGNEDEKERDYNETYFKYNNEKYKSKYNLKEKDIYVSNSKYINSEKNKHYDMYSHSKRSRGICTNLRNDNVTRDIYREEECNIWNDDLHARSIKKLNDLKRKENEYNVDDYYNCEKEEMEEMEEMEEIEEIEEREEREEREDEKGKENGKERNDKNINFHINQINEQAAEGHLIYHYIPSIHKVNTHNINYYPTYDKIMEHYNNKYNWLYHRTALFEPMDISYAERRHVMEPILTYEKEKMGNILFSNNNSSIYFVGNEKNMMHDNIHNNINEEEDETSNDDFFNKELQTCVSCYQYIKEKVPSNKIFIESTCLNCGQFIKKSLCLILIELLKPQVQNILSDVSFYEQCYND
ncbi:zinc finger protein, putative [Plasmodium reichenowi]|uniref:Zinc finger protein, putative n=1 Tax=Plasmodium reichenowi TaxID=5854 RepID=A0A151LR95_PLARE|nr:zinc finger protein, putative [Plasmodium reichenowi]KYO01629.1 zinc finger protein, putative [Plasmodium reichenowi]